MAYLYVTEQGAKITQSGNRIVINKEKQKLADVPLIKINAVLLYGNIQITTQAMRCLLDNGIETVFFNYYGKLYGFLTPPKSKNIVLRIRHYESAQNPQLALKIAKQIVQAKIINMRELLSRHLKNYSDSEISSAVASLNEWSRKSEYKQKAQNLLGIEGAATVAYFNAFRKMFRSELKFNGRNRRPPMDEINALLSYTYAIL
ncbi:MAG TPA: CRISPR-associated endonuclease Cas1, partial [Candidatus Marinimicrobia bacterium]|nr:CRISPR-associated endonuclease Cas1 [Candidatus Neomarinimicrobiota bacterium]